jgi:hypothetical protein
MAQTSAGLASAATDNEARKIVKHDGQSSSANPPKKQALRLIAALKANLAGATEPALRERLSATIAALERRP